MKRLQLLFRNLGLGDMLLHSPLIFLALDHGLSVDVVYEAAATQEAADLLFANEPRVRFLHGGKPAPAYDATVAFDRGALLRLLWTGGTQAVLPMPVPAHRTGQIRVFNTLLAPALRARGIECGALHPNPGLSVARMVFDEFADWLGARATHSDYVARLSGRLPRAPAGKATVVVHLFRDSSFKQLSGDALAALARGLAGIVGAAVEEMVILFNPGNVFEKETATHFAAKLKETGARATLRTSAPLREIASLLSSAALYVGVDHGISHLAGLLCPRSIVFYGGSRRHSDMHLIWRPLVEEDEVASRGDHVSLLRGRARAAVLIHPRREDYLAHANPDSQLINDVATPENLRSALALLGFSA